MCEQFMGLWCHNSSSFDDTTTSEGLCEFEGYIDHNNNFEFFCLLIHWINTETSQKMKLHRMFNDVALSWQHMMVMNITRLNLV